MIDSLVEKSVPMTHGNTILLVYERGKPYKVIND